MDTVRLAACCVVPGVCAGRSLPGSWLCIARQEAHAGVEQGIRNLHFGWFACLIGDLCSHGQRVRAVLTGPGSEQVAVRKLDPRAATAGACFAWWATIPVFTWTPPAVT